MGLRGVWHSISVLNSFPDVSRVAHGLFFFPAGKEIPSVNNDGLLAG